MKQSLNTLTLAPALHGYQKRTFSSHEVVTACLDQIKATNSQLNTFLTLNPHCLTEAKLADAQISSDSQIFTSKPLLGIPIAIKDNFLTQGLTTTASAKVLESFIPPFDATAVARLKQAGAIILGKTNMDAWAHGSSTETSDFGPTKNPWNLDYVPGGSSGGSAAAVSAHQCLAAIGSETAGSVRGPAAWCGVTGLKPTYGRVSRYGVIAMASSTDSPGPITKNVEDAAYILNIIAGHDPYDATTIPGQFQLKPKAFQSSITGLRVGLITDYLVKELDSQVRQTIIATLAVFKNLGAQVDEVTLLDPHYAIGVYTILQRSEVSSNLARFDGIRYGHDRHFLSYEAKKRIMLGTFSLSTGYYDEYYKKAQKVRTLIVDDFNRAFSRYDVLIGPTMPGHATRLGDADQHPYFGELMDMLTEASSIAGICGISVPCGFVNGLPIGLQIMGAQGNELNIVKAAYNYQKATSWHQQSPS